MALGLKSVIFSVADQARAKALFGAHLGTAPEVDEAYYVGFKTGSQDDGLDPRGHAKGMTGSVACVHVDDIQDRLLRLQDAGAVMKQEVTDVGGGRLISAVSDVDGAAIGLLQDS